MSSDDYHRWVRRYRDRVYTFAFYTLRQREDAEDVTQEVLIRLWRHRAKVAQDSVLSWLLKVTRNACLDSIRRAKARHARVEPATDERLLDEATCERPTPQSVAEANDFDRALRLALDDLAPSYREIVVLREIDGLKYDEIAMITGRSLSSVKVSLHRARKQLRDRLRSHAGAEHPTHDDEKPNPPMKPTCVRPRPPRPGLLGSQQPELKREIAHA